MTKNAIPVGISFPKELLERIDEMRGDVARSRFILRMIEKYYSDMEAKKKK